MEYRYLHRIRSNLCQMPLVESPSEALCPITVAVRVRPPADPSAPPCLFVNGPHSVRVLDLQGDRSQVLPRPPTSLIFTADAVFASGSAEETDTGKVACAPCDGSQDGIFHSIGVPLVHNALNGFFGCLLVLGPPHSGKTHTLLGSPAALGLAPRLIAELCRVSPELTVSLSVADLGEKFVDLLAELPSVLPVSVKTGTDGPEFSADAVPVWSRVASEEAGLALLSQTQGASGAEPCHRLYRIAVTAPSGATSCVVLAELHHSVLQDAVGRGLSYSDLLNLADRAGPGPSPASRLMHWALSGNCKTSVMATLSPDESALRLGLRALRIADKLCQLQTKPRGVGPPMPPPSRQGSLAPGQLGCETRPQSQAKTARSLEAPGKGPPPSSVAKPPLPHVRIGRPALSAGLRPLGKVLVKPRRRSEARSTAEGEESKERRASSPLPVPEGKLENPPPISSTLPHPTGNPPHTAGAVFVTPRVAMPQTSTTGNNIKPGAEPHPNTLLHAVRELIRLQEAQSELLERSARSIELPPPKRRTGMSYLEAMCSQMKGGVAKICASW